MLLSEYDCWGSIMSVEIKLPLGSRSNFKLYWQDVARREFKAWPEDGKVTD